MIVCGDFLSDGMRKNSRRDPKSVSRVGGEKIDKTKGREESEALAIRIAFGVVEGRERVVLLKSLYYRRQEEET